ncbi:T9SS type A sorting domain-containing protein [Aquimarina sp. TRL1]|uniref:fibronectin type III domain-containing protein n=1 Tax=Aquimarina sp. (strain TRL1) TaxID=2736252 RepID=UPI00158B3C79|nr:fibronectin type III domain-containing protein [Aquimarina sp. TRL1]QKX05238.1 T9SS type A sorting domain-containing protein [Aquimarina sp. TRL1]
MKNFHFKKGEVTPRAFKTLHLFILFVICYVGIVSAQDTPYVLGKESIFQEVLNQQKNSTLTLKTSDTETLSVKINIKEGDNTNYSIIGSVLLQEKSNGLEPLFSVRKFNGLLEGEIIMYEQKKAYKISSGDQGNVLIAEADINELLCVEFESEEVTDSSAPVNTKAAVPSLESLPGATAVIYLDFDGEVVSGTRWLNGRTINARPAGFSDQKILTTWRIMAEDFSAFNINVTTRRDVFDRAPKNRRMMCIFTTTKDAAPSAGGVAYLNSFSWNTDDPCWVFNLGNRSAGETGSHEIGHTLGLSHDGIRSGTTYYSGHGQWSPIMGWSASKPIGHWSKGEYNNANQKEDDLAIIAGSRNGFGYKQDDHSNSTNGATAIVADAGGNVKKEDNNGIITTRQDKDLFSFTTSGGNASFNFDPDPYYPNLNIKARILNAQGQEVASSDPSGLKASISTNLAKGTYYIEIDGVGEGNLSSGYSDYSSIGYFSISGKYIAGSDGGDTTAPSTPGNLTVSATTQSSVSLSWTASTDNVGVTGYDVYQGNTMVSSVSGTSTTVNGLTPSTTYSFKVKAKDAAGNTSAFSNTVSATTQGGDTTCDAVTGVKATNITKTAATINWNAVSTPTYTLEYKKSTDATYTSTKTTEASKVLTELSPKTTYQVRVKYTCPNGNNDGNICEGVPPYRRGTGYRPGDKVTYEGSLYQLNNNYRWDKLGACGSGSTANSTDAPYSTVISFTTLEDTTGGLCDGIAAWRPYPKVYRRGEKAVYNGILYEAQYNGTYWNPTYGFWTRLGSCSGGAFATESFDETTVEKLSVFPNPATDRVSVSFMGGSQQTSHIQLINLVGKVILQKEVKVTPGRNLIHLDISEIESGVYFIKNGTLSPKKIVIN